MSSPSPSSKSNGSRRRLKRTRSSPPSFPINVEIDTSAVVKRSESWSPLISSDSVGHKLAKRETPKLESIHTKAAGMNPSQCLQPSACISGDEDVEDIQLDVSPSEHGGSSRTQPKSGCQEVSTNIPTRKNEAQNQTDRIQRVQIEPDRLGWARMYDLTRQLDKDRVADIKDDIDTLLVFAGLFSAVVTAFIIESYKNLQQQPEDMTNEILLQMSAQLASLSLNGNFVNSTASSFAPTPFMTAPSMVLINTLWALSLVIALITASLGILVKQWFHELLSYETHDPKERLKLRFFREAGIERWRVFAIASSLPLLLQLALLFFFAGFSVFLHGLNPIVGWVTTGVMIVWLVVFFFTAFAPAFSSQCPYKIPLLTQFLRQLRVGTAIWSRNMTLWLYSNTSERYFPKLEEWLDHIDNWFLARLKTREASEEDSLCKDASLDIPTVVCVRDLLRGEKLDEAVFHSLENLEIGKVIEMFYGSLKQNPVDRGLIPDVSDGIGRAMHILLSEFIEREGTQGLIGGENRDPPTSLRLYTVLSLLPSQAYDPMNSYVISKQYTLLFIHQIQESPTSAAFAILTMYSIRHCTMIKDPDRWNNLFLVLSGSESRIYGIGDQSLPNLVVATRILIHSLWDPNLPQRESDIKQITDFVATIRNDAGYSDPVVTPDPIAFVYVFAKVLQEFKTAVCHHRESVLEVMGELAEIVTDLDASCWSHSRKECAEWACRHLYWCGFEDEQNLCRKLRSLIDTWEQSWKW